MTVKIKDLATNEVREWTLDEVLEEINRDRSAEWIDYDDSDWLEGWHEWCEGEFYSIVNEASV